MELTCPKCRGEMRSYERNGVVVDQCAECRGIFLDRGELETLLDAEASWYAAGRLGAPLQAAASQGGSYGARETYPLTERQPALRIVPPPAAEAPSWTSDDAYDPGVRFDDRYDSTTPPRRTFLQQLFD
jgi:Zn-finger nucleic acid-binding protein